VSIHCNRTTKNTWDEEEEKGGDTEANLDFDADHIDLKELYRRAAENPNGTKGPFIGQKIHYEL